MRKILQAGSGSTRPLIIVYLFAAGAEETYLQSIPANATLVADTEATQNDYATVPTLQETVAALSSELGAKFSPVIVAGFSAGGFAVRRILAAGGDPDAVILADATYGTDVTVWADYAARAARGDRVFVASHSSNVRSAGEPARPSPWRNLQTITGMDLPLGSCDGPPAGVEIVSSPKRNAKKGNTIVWSYPDCDHSAQGAKVLPTVLLKEALARLEDGGVYGMTHGEALLVAGLAAVGTVTLFWIGLKALNGAHLAPKRGRKLARSNPIRPSAARTAGACVGRGGATTSSRG